MLDSDTKRRIDTARDILVGKVPDPKSQVEQITIALIYKFMDDMDAQAEEVGGKRKFFVGEFAPYGWAKLMAQSVSGEQRIALYADGMVKMTQNPGVPPLFRNIFKNAFLPYRDPETLKLFLKTINGFEYDHSERLGDAFEYLLSVLGSQGDAGQFRTPRHIIDFMVSIVDPKKNETVLDPACGTAGFLISAYKHILRANSTPAAIEKVSSNGEPEAKLHTSRIPAAKGDLLTPDERKKLADNFRGYDISPDMVRLSLMNMYLHGFKDPHVFEYDTLASQDRWNEMADVILANPPFMSPKGGIKPHNRFSVQSKRSEVLFVDYMAEHLTPAGRAGIIVPEGIIFQSQTSYTKLRKMLIEGYLIGVISLPSGVFMPYTGVKTSILIFDRSEAKRNPNIMFSDIRHIGFSLGVKRTVSEHNDLPHVERDYIAYYRGGELSRHSWLASRESILANGCNLSGARYRPKAESGAGRFAAIGEVCAITKGNSSSTTTTPGPYRLVLTAADSKTSNEYQFDAPAVCVPLISSLGHGKAALHRIHYAEGKFALANLLVALQPNDPEDLDVRFLYHALDCRRSDIAKLMQGAANVSMKPEDLAQFQIPLPPLEVQKEIVAEIEAYQKVIDGARAVLDHYRPHIPINPEWPMAELGELCEINSGGTPKREVDAYWNGDIPWITTSLIDFNVIDRAEEFITSEGLENSSAWIVPKGTVVMAMFGQGVTRGRVATLGIDAAMNQACAAFTIRDHRITSAYLYHALEAEYEKLRELSEARGGNQSNLSGAVLKQYAIPLPPHAAQREIVAEIEGEQRLVEGNRQLIERMEKKIAATLARIWGEESEPAIVGVEAVAVE
jgi:type I restriction enzyme M protein